jgi:hypothetical protein
MREISRRDLLIGSGALITAAVLGSSCEDSNPLGQEETPEFSFIDVLMKNDGKVRVISAKPADLFTRDIGINTIGLYREIDSYKFYMFCGFTEDVVPIPLGTRRNDQDLKNVSGLVPFDPLFNLELAHENAIKRQKNISENFEETARVSNAFVDAGLSYGYSSFEMVPEIGEDFMYYIGENFLYLQTDTGLQLSDSAILRARIKFEGEPIIDGERS